jgi:ribosomal protein S18 acetylase RimI-like enzyme
MTMIELSHKFTLHSVGEEDIDAILKVYQECEDFLSLGPVANASKTMVLADLEISRQAGGVFRGIFQADGTMVGIIDVVLSGFEGNPKHAFLELLMIGAPYRGQGIGEWVVGEVEKEIRQNPQVKAILSGVQVNNPTAIQFWQRMGYQIVSQAHTLPDTTTVFDLRKELI